MPKKVRLICATRMSRERFFAESALGRSLALYNYLANVVELQLFADNTRSLPELYNEAIERAAREPAILVFIHDDVHLCDFFWFDKIQAALQNFAIIGLAGNRRRLPRQPAWCFVDTRGTWDQRENLSGVVGGGKGFPCSLIAAYGPVPQQCLLLDGMLLAVDSDTLIKGQLRFDTRFAFHFYDMDFCRQAEAKGLKMGTWPISVIHESGGNYDSDAWRQGLRLYLEKYGD